MNPLSDCFVDAEAIAQHQQRLLDSVAYRQRLPDESGTTPLLGAPRRWSCWLNLRWRILSIVVAPVRGNSAASGAATIARISITPSPSTVAARAYPPSGASCRGYRPARRRCARLA